VFAIKAYRSTVLSRCLVDSHAHLFLPVKCARHRRLNLTDRIVFDLLGTSKGFDDHLLDKRGAKDARLQFEVRDVMLFHLHR